MGARKTSARWRAEAMRGESLGAEGIDWSYVTCCRAMGYHLVRLGKFLICSIEQLIPGQEMIPAFLSSTVV